MSSTLQARGKENGNERPGANTVDLRRLVGYTVEEPEGPVQTNNGQAIMPPPLLTPMYNIGEVIKVRPYYRHPIFLLSCQGMDAFPCELQAGKDII